jgi:hypothetical protein
LRELAALANKVPKSAVIAAVESAGIELRDTQPLNILLILFTFAVLNNGTDCSDEQPLNIVSIVVIFAVLNNGTD